MNRHNLEDEIALVRELRQNLQYERSETKKVRDELLCIGQMQAVLLAILQKTKGLSVDQLNEITYSDRKMRALDLKIRKRLAAELRKQYRRAGVEPPEYLAGGPGSSLPEAQ